MPRKEELAAALYGAFLLARFDARGMQHFDVSLQGFWRSFFALVLILPFGLYSLVVSYPETEASRMWVVLVVAAYYVIDWISFPLVMVPIARRMGLSQTYIPFIIASNWSTVIQSALFFVLSVFVQANVLPLLALQMISLMILVYAFMYQVFVARMSLSASALLAVGVTVLDFVLSYWLLIQSERFY